MSGDPQATARAAAEASDRAPHDAGAALHAAEMLLRADDPSRAVAYAERAVAIDPASGRAPRVLSGMLDAAGRRTEAIAAARQSLGREPDAGDTQLHLAGLLALDRCWPEALDLLFAYVATSAGDARGWRLLSSVLQQTGRLEQAADAARKACGADPDEIEYRLNLASLLSARGLYTDALETLIGDGPAVWRCRAEIYAVLGDLSAALRAAEQAVALSPEDAESQAALRHVAGMCGVPQRAETEPPPPPRRPRLELAPSGFAEDVATRGRVIYAIMLREIHTRFGHTRLGYLWAFLEPIGHLATLGVVFAALNHAPPPVGDNLFLFYITGLIPFLMFSHVAQHVMQVADDGNAMLRLPVIKRTDVMLAQGLLQLATEICVGLVIFSVAGLLGEQVVPGDILTVIESISLLGTVALGVGAVNMTIQGFVRSYDTSFAALIRLMYFGSGIYYSPIAMPDWIRSWLVWNPVLQGIEFFRSGFYPQYAPHWLDVPYLATWAVGSVGLGFALERATRARMAVMA